LCTRNPFEKNEQLSRMVDEIKRFFC